MYNVRQCTLSGIWACGLRTLIGTGTFFLLILTGRVSADQDFNILTPKTQSKAVELLELVYSFSVYTTAGIHTRVELISEALLETPFEWESLGEGRNGIIDDDPLLKLESFDCVTFVETVIAFSRAEKIDEVIPNLINIRYRSGEISFENRNHFPSLDWIPSNIASGNVADITQEVAGQIMLTEVTTQIDKGRWIRNLNNHPIFRKKLLLKNNNLEIEGYLSSIARQFSLTNVSVKFLSKENLFFKELTSNTIIPNWNVIDRIPSGSIILIVRPRGSYLGDTGTEQNISHFGFAIRRCEVLLYRYATPIGPKCVTETEFIAYLKKFYLNSKFVGLLILDPLPRKL